MKKVCALLQQQTRKYVLQTIAYVLMEKFKKDLKFHAYKRVQWKAQVQILCCKLADRGKWSQV